MHAVRHVSHAIPSEITEHKRSWGLGCIPSPGPLPAKYAYIAAGPGPVRMSSASAANNPNDRISLVRADIDNLLVANRTPDAHRFPGSYQNQNSSIAGEG